MTGVEWRYRPAGGALVEAWELTDTVTGYAMFHVTPDFLRDAAGARQFVTQFIAERLGQAYADVAWPRDMLELTGSRQRASGR